MNLQTQYENLILQIILNAINDEGVEYLDSDTGRNWLASIELDSQVAKNALTLTNGKIKDIRYINEHLDD